MLLGDFLTFVLREERPRLVSTETASIQRNVPRQGLCTQEEVLANRKFYFLTKQERGQKAAAEIHRNIQPLRNLDELCRHTPTLVTYTEPNSRGQHLNRSPNVAQLHQSDGDFLGVTLEAFQSGLDCWILSGTAPSLVFSIVLETEKETVQR